MKTLLTDQFFLTLFDTYRAANGYRLRVASTQAEQNACSDFVHQIFSQTGYYDSPRQPEMIPDDGMNACIGRVEYRNKIVGVVKVVTSRDRFPVEYFFNVKFPNDIPRGNICEIARFAISPEHRRKNSLVAMSLFQFAMAYSAQVGARWWLGCSPALLLHGYRSYFEQWQILDQGPLGSEQKKFRTGRERFFDGGLDLKVYLIDTAPVSITAIGQEVLRRRRSRKGWARQSAPRRMRKQAA